MKLLNLDPIVKSVEKRVVVVNGVNHEIRSLNVEQFLQIVDESMRNLDSVRPTLSINLLQPEGGGR